jgi:hypothetical protein
MAMNPGPKHQFQQIGSSDMGFLRSVVGYSRTDKERNIDIRQQINIFNIGERVKDADRIIQNIL